MMRKASSYDIRCVSTTLAKHKDDEASFTRWNKINDQPRDGLRFRTIILHRQRGIEVQ